MVSISITSAAHGGLPGTERSLYLGSPGLPHQPVLLRESKAIAFLVPFKIHHLLPLLFWSRNLKQLSVRNSFLGPLALLQPAGGFMNFSAGRDQYLARLAFSFCLIWNVSSGFCVLSARSHNWQSTGLYRCVFSNILKGLILPLPKLFD